MYSQISVEKVLLFSLLLLIFNAMYLLTHWQECCNTAIDVLRISKRFETSAITSGLWVMTCHKGKHKLDKRLIFTAHLGVAYSSHSHHISCCIFSFSLTTRSRINSVVDESKYMQASNLIDALHKTDRNLIEIHWQSAWFGYSSLIIRGRICSKLWRSDIILWE
jgi:hypothetical protein